MIIIIIDLFWQRWWRGNGLSAVDSVRVRVRLHELLLGAFRANDVFAVGDETSAHQRSLARGADETIVVPVAVLEWDESSATNPYAAGRKKKHKRIKQTSYNDIIIYTEVQDL